MPAAWALIYTAHLWFPISGFPALVDKPTYNVDISDEDSLIPVHKTLRISSLPLCP